MAALAASTAFVAGPTMAWAQTASGAMPGAGMVTSPNAMVLEHAAARDSQHVLAVGAGRLYRLERDHWVLQTLQGAEARDVTASHGFLWILARGTGPNLGHALIVRTRDGDDLLAVATPALGADCDPRALLVAHDGDYFVGGARPALVRVQNGAWSAMPVAAPRVLTLRRTRDDMLIAWHGDDLVTESRWGESTTVSLADYLDTLVDANGGGYVVHTHGEISHGRPAHEVEAVTTPVSFAPCVAAVLPGERLVVVGAHGPYAEWQHHRWQVITGEFPAVPVAVLPTEPPLIIGADGQVTAVQGTTVRVVVAMTAPSAGVHSPAP